MKNYDEKRYVKIFLLSTINGQDKNYDGSFHILIPVLISGHKNGQRDKCEKWGG